MHFLCLTPFPPDPPDLLSRQVWKGEVVGREGGIGTRGHEVVVICRQEEPTRNF